MFEGPKCSRVKLSRPDKNPRNFSPSKILGYMVDSGLVKMSASEKAKGDY